MSTPWDARTYDVSSTPAPDATILDVGCGTARVTESLLALVPAGRVLAIDAAPRWWSWPGPDLGTARTFGARTCSSSSWPSPSM